MKNAARDASWPPPLPTLPCKTVRKVGDRGWAMSCRTTSAGAAAGRAATCRKAVSSRTVKAEIDVMAGEVVQAILPAEWRLARKSFFARGRGTHDVGWQATTRLGHDRP